MQNSDSQFTSDTSLIGVTTDDAAPLWTTTSVSANWTPLNNQEDFENIIPYKIATMPDGTMLTIGYGQEIYLRTSHSIGWKKIPRSGAVSAITVLPDATIVGIGMRPTQLYRRRLTDYSPNWDGPFDTAGHPLSDIAATPDGKLIAVAENHDVLEAETISGPWRTLITNASNTNIQCIEVLPDNTIVGYSSASGLLFLDRSGSPLWRPYNTTVKSLRSIASLAPVNRLNRRLSSFDHVVVLMLENRSFDNLLGYMYPDNVPYNAPAGKEFNGVSGKPLYNPVPQEYITHDSGTQVHVTEVGTVVRQDGLGQKFNYFQPYPDPGEEYSHVNTQLFNYIRGKSNPPYNLPEGSPKPSMQGFIKDYIENLRDNELGETPSYAQFKMIMRCYTTEALPVVTTLAREFGVFDHWFCAVPSQTWCNRAFWHAGTSWGHVNNGHKLSWVRGSSAPTIFNQIHNSGSDSPLDWKVYVGDPKIEGLDISRVLGQTRGLGWLRYLDIPVSLTLIIHLRALAKFVRIIPGRPQPKFQEMGKFYEDLDAGSLPSYSFIEPRFITPHNDMHPSSVPGEASAVGLGIDTRGEVGSVALGEKLVLDVYNAIKGSRKYSQNTLLVITFDEHGGCYDHVAPPMNVIPPNPEAGVGEDGFDFQRLGLRVPTIMVSANIAPNTVINTPMHHGSFTSTVQSKWNSMLPGNFPQLSSRPAPMFAEVFTAETPRPVSEWPEIADLDLPDPISDEDARKLPLNELQRSIISGVANFPDKKPPQEDIDALETLGDALDYVKQFLTAAVRDED